MSSNKDTSRDSAVSKILSRASVYATLASHDTKHAAKHAAPKHNNDDLTEFYATTVSETWHRTRPTLDGKNTAGRPLSKYDVTGRIQERALTLTGGGYNTRVIGAEGHNSKKTKANQSSRSSRKRARTELLERVGVLSSASENEEFLRALNDQWNVYVGKVLGLRNIFTDETKNGTVVATTASRQHALSLMHARLSQLMANGDAAMEWVGARVRIDVCAAAKNYAGRTGILVAQTKNTWRVAVTTTTTTAAVSFDERNHEPLAETLIVPKRGAVVTSLIPFPVQQKATPIDITPSRCLEIVLQRNLAY